MIWLSCSKNLTQMPDLSQVPNIVKLILNDCTSLVQVYSASSLLKLDEVDLDGCDQLRSVNLPDPYDLKIFYWNGCPLQSLPSNFLPESLVQLSIRDSNLEQLWDGDRVFYFILVLFFLLQLDFCFFISSSKMLRKSFFRKFISQDSNFVGSSFFDVHRIQQYIS